MARAAATPSLPRPARTPEPSLYRLLRGLAAVGVFREEEDRRFSLTPLGDCLRSDAPEPVGPLAAFFGQPDYWHAWGDLLHSVQTGSAPFATSTG